MANMVRRKKKKKVTKMRKPHNINVGSLIFLGIFVYLIISVYIYVTRDKIQMYEVAEGSIVDDKTYTGLILREETIKTADSAGYVNYYVREGKKVAVGSCVYSLDETGQMTKFLDENQSESTTIRSENLEDLKRQLSAFSLSYEDNAFDVVYDVKYNLEAAVLEYANLGVMENLSALMQENGIVFRQIMADQSGVVSYGIDGFEGMTPQMVKKDSFNRDSYKKEITKTGTQVAAQAPVYKIVSSENWNVVFALDEEDKEKLADKTTLEVMFTDRKMKLSGTFSLCNGADGESYGLLSFDNYMTQFLSDRYAQFEIVSEKVTGLKIPISSVTTKDFYVIPAEYLAEGGDSSNKGFLREVYTAQGTTAEFVPTTLYYETEDSYYVDKTDFSAGDYLIKPNSADRYQIGATAALQGVYNINKGYTVFKQIDVLASNDKFYIVRKGMSYGLSVYDHIVLDAHTAEEDKTVYQ
ncbi:MAG: HlyD family efflux transporter periplasmic adaptor subunit [bacterium]|nr:HlyD family efflux transporter periplasmic adaptor subunit [bacterium]